jgi:hypothetical protein
VNFGQRRVSVHALARLVSAYSVILNRKHEKRANWPLFPAKNRHRPPILRSILLPHLVINDHYFVVHEVVLVVLEKAWEGAATNLGSPLANQKFGSFAFFFIT